MSHDILGEMFYSYKQIAWHALGTVSQERDTATVAAEKAGISRIEIVKLPAVVEIEPGKYVNDPERFALVRKPLKEDDQHRIFGYVSADYSFIPYMDLMKLLDPLTEQWGMETVGALRNGQTIFAALDAGEHDVAGVDPIQRYFTVSDTLDGQSGFHMMFTPVRTVCRNTLRAAKAAATVAVTLNHSREISDAVKFRFALMKQMAKAQEKVEFDFELMAKAVLEPDEVKAIFEVAYPAPSKPRKVQMLESLQLENNLEIMELAHYASLESSNKQWQYLVDRSLEMRQTAALVFESTAEEYAPVLRGTAWHAYNAVTALESHRDSRSDAVETAESIMFGERARTMSRAYEKALELSLN